MTKHEQLTKGIARGMTRNYQAELKKQAHQALKLAKVTDRAARRADWLAYREEVRRLTELEPLHLVPGIELRGQEWHLDHVVSIYTAYLNGWPVGRRADVTNLQILPWEENFRKGHSSFCSLASRQLLSN